MMMQSLIFIPSHRIKTKTTAMNAPDYADALGGVHLPLMGGSESTIGGCLGEGE